MRRLRAKSSGSLVSQKYSLTFLSLANFSRLIFYTMIKYTIYDRILDKTQFSVIFM